MKHPLFAEMGDNYPRHLEEQFDRILSRIEDLWDTNEIDNYFSELLIDKRGGRQGFPSAVAQDILKLKELRESEHLRGPESTEDAIYELALQGFETTRDDFLRALREGRQEIVDLYVRAGFNLNFFDESGATPLLAALKKGYTVVARVLLRATTDLNARDQLGLTPLSIACTRNTPGNQHIAQTLIRRGAFINIRDRLGNTPLLLALQAGMLPVAEMLVERGADLGVTNRRGDSVWTLLEKIENHPATRLYQLIQEKASATATPQPPPNSP